MKELVEVLKSYYIGPNDLYNDSGIDETELVYEKDGVELYYCPSYCYMDVFGLTDEEFEELKTML